MVVTLSLVPEDKYLGGNMYKDIVNYCVISRSAYNYMDRNDEKFNEFMSELQGEYVIKKSAIKIIEPTLVQLSQLLFQKYKAIETNRDIFFDGYLDKDNPEISEKVFIMQDINTLMDIYTNAEIKDRLSGYELFYPKDILYDSDIEAFLFLELLKLEPPISITLASKDNITLSYYNTSGYIPLRLEAEMSLIARKNKKNRKLTNFDDLDFKTMLVELWALGYLKSSLIDINDVEKHYT